MRVQLGDVAALRDDQLALLGRLGVGESGEGAGDRPGGAQRGGAPEEFASGQLHLQFLLVPHAGQDLTGAGPYGGLGSRWRLL